MKLSFFMVLITCFNVSAEVFSQEKISIDVRNTSIEKVFRKIEKQSNYHFVYSATFVPVDKNVTLNVKDYLVTDVLKEILKGTDLNFSIADNGLVVISNQSKSLNNVTISGTVTDLSGAALPGVTVLAKGTKKGTSTDLQGKYTLTVAEDAVLIFSLVGYTSIEKQVGTSKTINVVLSESNNNLDDVVVVGYGTTTKRKINSAVSTLSMENVAPLPVQSINDAIAGRVQGVIVTSATGAPGAKSTISIRGGGTPLYVIDNMIRSANDFANLNPNDIQTYSILKDAAATALYGALGGNGVVLVTTKRGKEGQTNINYSFNQIFSQPTLFPDRLGSYENLSAVKKVYDAEGLQFTRTDAELELFRNQSDPFNYPNTNWREIGLKNFAAEQRHDFSISSGTKQLTYYGSGSYYQQGSNLRTDNNFNKRITYRLNTVSDFEKVHLKVTTGIDGYVETNSVPNSSTAGSYPALFQHIQQKLSSQLAYNQFGLPYNGTTDNPAIELSPLSGYNKGTSRIFNSILALDYAAPFLKGLVLKASGNYNMWNSMNKSWNATAPSYALNSNSPILGNPPSLGATRGDGSTLLLQAFVNYDGKFGDHNVEFTGGYEQAKNTSNSLSGSRQRYQIIFDQFIAGPTVDQTINGSESESARAGFISRLAYNYKSKYFAEGTLRYDGNDLFPTDKQWGNFYAVSAGYVMSEESFMKSLADKHILDYLKFRGSYGLTGIADGIGRFQYIPGYTINANAWVINGQPVQGTSEPGTLPSVNFSWYSIKSRNFGLDFATLNNRLTGTLDYFYMRTTGYVVGDTRYSAPLGIGLPPINFKEAALRREGTEFNLTWNSSIRDFSYKVGFNLTYFNDMWERNPSEQEADLKNPYTRQSGNIGGRFGNGLRNLGFYTENGQLLTGARLNANKVVAGDLRYEDTNGDGQITGADNRRIGKSTMPRANYGLTLDLAYKGFYFNAVAMASGDRDRYLSGIVQGSSVQNLLVYGYQQDYWRPDNTDARFPRQVSQPGVNNSNNYQSSDFWLLRSGFLRLKYAQLGYDLKTVLLKNAPFKQFKVFASGTNLLTSAKSKEFFIDPESNAANEDYPIQRTISFGVNVGF